MSTRSCNDRICPPAFLVDYKDSGGYCSYRHATPLKHYRGKPISGPWSSILRITLSPWLRPKYAFCRRFYIGWRRPGSREATWSHLESYLELVSNMSPTIFLLEIRGFISKRGITSMVPSDNTPYFHRFGPTLPAISSTDLHDLADEQRISWNFVAPPAARCDDVGSEWSASSRTD